jgi:hypothetical protein
LIDGEFTVGLYDPPETVGRWFGVAVASMLGVVARERVVTAAQWSRGGCALVLTVPA